jgi:DNA-nicking Smr family endonuclease
MPGRRLSAEERALWARVAATVTPLEGKASTPAPSVPGEIGGQVSAQHLARSDGSARLHAARTEPSKPVPPPADTLDGGWDRRLRRGVVAPDRAVDLHGHSLATAHAALDHALARAIADELRVLLVVTGRPPKPERSGRGLIRASIGDWLATSPHRSRIAAVRHAHPRHGGAGALYLILRRKRDA